MRKLDFDLGPSKNMYFELGWHVLMDCVDDEMSLSFEERNTKERIFFSTGSYRGLPSHMTGADALRSRLSKLPSNPSKRGAEGPAL
jgi:hypothetical protein